MNLVMIRKKIYNSWWKGVFTNFAATGAPLTAYMLVDPNSISFRLVEYNKFVVQRDDICWITIKEDEENNQFLFYASRNGAIYTTNVEEINKIKSLLNRGGILSIKAEFSQYNNYLFKLDVSGYNKAKEFLSLCVGSEL